MPRRQLVPPTEATDGEELLPVKEDVCPTHPGDLVAHSPALAHQLLFQVERVGRVVDTLAVPGDGLAVELFWNYRSLPQLDVLLVRPHVVEVAQAGCRAADKSAMLRLDHCQHPRQGIWFQQHVVVE